MEDSFTRRTRILNTLKGNKRITRKQLSEMTDVSIRTIYTDMMYISGNYPVASFPGRNGGYEWTGEREATLSASEARTILAHINRENCTEEEAKLIRKLEALVKEAEREPKR